jgi:hypothetical protein
METEKFLLTGFDAAEDRVIEYFQKRSGTDLSIENTARRKDRYSFSSVMGYTIGHLFLRKRGSRCHQKNCFHG